MMDRLDPYISWCNNYLALPCLPSRRITDMTLTDSSSNPPRYEDDLRRLIDAAHARELKVLLDFVANHVSDQHPAFPGSSEPVVTESGNGSPS